MFIFTITASHVKQELSKTDNIGHIMQQKFWNHLILIAQIVIKFI